ncbi:MAG: hypothetical protein KU37_09430 [Sulfuricurvum sp. PC08-66]|nr:MAG: hypothetical protein KU37_09430 [Sulfuricurvum sp. PC08-66]
MSIKENVTVIKDELTQEEKFFEKMVNFEYFYKKYRIYIWGLFVAVIAYFSVAYSMEYIEANRIQEANSAYRVLLENPEDSSAQATLASKSQALYDLYLFNQAVKKSDVALFEKLKASTTYAIADMAKYNHAMLSNDTQALKAYIDGNGLFFNDIVRIHLATQMLQAQDISAAHQMLSGIGEKSPFYAQAQLLMHYGIAK